MALTNTHYFYVEDENGTPQHTTLQEILNKIPEPELLEIADSLNDNDPTKALSAAQGYELAGRIDGIATARKVSDIAGRNDLTGLNPLATIHVEDDGDGKWARYQPMSVTATGKGQNWVKTMDQDALINGVVATSLAYVAAPDKGTITNTSGDDAVIPAVSDMNAGLMTPAQKGDVADNTEKRHEAVTVPANGPLSIDDNQGLSFNIKDLPAA